ncbi:hypothetical protein CYMTET_14765 [Cymbomonas tetramitiformis]|uniref:Methyltransferase FkbM domain-containing protein n=1 Tax=Cymbomonas tetramitiformis TaxID=36881 RepID=A0AAE0GFP9_9CHLO|nr:hypothetical protein CYMTET_14765 [Cymbomonas tetramitiformis]
MQLSHSLVLLVVLGLVSISTYKDIWLAGERSTRTPKAEISKNTQHRFIQSGPLLETDFGLPFDIPSTCRYVYVDCGCNLGVNLRKVFEPHLYEKAFFLEYFDKRFGTPEQRIRPDWGMCAFGFEANPYHETRLNAIQESYRRQGWQVFTATSTAVGHSNGKTKLFRDVDERPGDRYFKPGRLVGSTSASTMHDHGVGYSMVKRVDLTSFLLKLQSRSIPEVNGNGTEVVPPPAIVLKMDVEGEEHFIIPKLIISGALCRVDTLFVEWHSWPKTEDRWHMDSLPQVLHDLLKANPDCPTEYLDKDDESFAKDRNKSVSGSETFNDLP